MHKKEKIVIYTIICVWIAAIGIGLYFYLRGGLIDAARSGNTSMIYALAALGADVNAKDKNGYTPLHHAMNRGDDEVVKFLIEKGADVNAKASSDGKTPLLIEGSHETVKLLLASGADIKAIDKDGNTAMHTAGAYYKDVAEAIIAKGGDVNAKNIYGFTPLHVAARADDGGGVVEVLLSKGAEVNAKAGEDGATPLHLAIESGDAAMVEAIVAAGADVNAVDNDGQTPLHYTAYSYADGMKEKVELLVVSGANVNAVDKHGCTALHTVISEGWEEMLWLLEDRGADMEGNTPAPVAKEGEEPSAVEALIASGADLSAKDSEGRTPQDLADALDDKAAAKVIGAFLRQFAAKPQQQVQ
ncbi:MAG: ankyrin repeat domain-containing protein [Deltaproteobacteria bacterium]|nr:ankyrin repeat domain-containing protein [Deltaproteobacteria bacterium]